MLIVFRVDSGYKIGSGHIMRCRNLGLHLIKKNHQVVFLSQEIPGNLITLLQNDNCFQVLALSSKLNGGGGGDENDEVKMTDDTFTWLGDTWNNDVTKCVNILQLNKLVDIDLLIVDHYAIDYQWQNQMKEELNIKKILVIDDLFNRKHSCDALLDQTLYLNDLNPYQSRGLIGAECKDFMIGPKYILLNSLFNEYHHLVEKSLPNLDLARNELDQKMQVLINFGGADLVQETEKVVEVLLKNQKKFKKVDFVILLGPLYVNSEKITSIIKNEHNFTVYQGLNFFEVCKLLQNSDLCIGAPGVSVYERCCLGVPSILISLAENQEQNAINLEKAGAVKYLGKTGEWDEQDLIQTFEQLLINKSMLANLKIAGIKLVDGAGCNRVMEILGI